MNPAPAVGAHLLDRLGEHRVLDYYQLLQSPDLTLDPLVLAASMIVAGRRLGWVRQHRSPASSGGSHRVGSRWYTGWSLTWPGNVSGHLDPRPSSLVVDERCYRIESGLVMDRNHSYWEGLLARRNEDPYPRCMLPRTASPGRWVVM